MRRSYYSDSIADFVEKDEGAILGVLVEACPFDITPLQRNAWLAEIQITKQALEQHCSRYGKVYFEYDIPRLGGRIDVLAVIENVIFVIEFKVGADTVTVSARDQVWDYALDLKNFHQTSQAAMIAPIVVATKADLPQVSTTPPHEDKLLSPMACNADTLADAIGNTLNVADGAMIVAEDWERGRYSPTPTIIEAATALYGGHSVQEISRSDAGATNLRTTSDTIAQVIQSAKEHSNKVICFVTGVPGAGKTLVGLDIATKYLDKNSELYSVFLSGNGPLVNILREALARDKVRREQERGASKPKIGTARRAVKTFIQNVHHFRDDCIRDEGAPLEHVALFDEAQRAWDTPTLTNFMKRRNNDHDFNQSEPEFLISCMNRHKDWAAVVCLIGSGQEINIGEEAGIGGWITALTEKFPAWHMYISPHMTDNKDDATNIRAQLKKHAQKVTEKETLHLAVSMRSFRAEKVSLLVKQLLDLESEHAGRTLHTLKERYPIVLTRDLRQAKQWLRQHARGSERYGMMVSSKAERLKPHAIDVRPKIDPIHWFLDSKEDVRSSYYLEDVVTEFDIQGLEIDWACLTWDADLRYASQAKGWEHWSFRGTRWNRIRAMERKMYQKNAYRVLLTRARQGMVIVVPEGDASDPTRDKSYYDPTFDYLRGIGFPVL